VHFPAAARAPRPGELVEVRIERALAHSLLGAPPAAEPASRRSALPVVA
jgi:hypothetical protein